MIHLDHIAICCRNLYETTYRISQSTGLGNYDGGFFKGWGIANKIIPLGDDVYIEVESVVDAFELKQGNLARWYYDRAWHGDSFLGLCLRADSWEEMEAFAAHHKTKVFTELTPRQRMELPPTAAKSSPGAGRSGSTPIAVYAWPRGFPNLYLFADMKAHPSRIPVLPGTGRVTPRGVSFLEVGGNREQWRDWMGDFSISHLPLRFNGRKPGLYAVGIKSDEGEIVLRLPSSTEFGDVPDFGEKVRTL